MLLWLAFAACTAVIVFAGVNLSRAGDAIAEKSGLGKTWIGVVLLASVTSLPELVTGLSAVTYVGAPDIAVGNVLGACVFNMLIFAILDVFLKATPLGARAHRSHVLSAGFGIVLLGIVAMGLAAGPRLGSLGWIGPATPVILAAYVLGMRSVFSHERRLALQRPAEEPEESPRYADASARAVALRFAGHSMLVIAAAIVLPSVGTGLAEQTGLGQTFVGNIVIALSTTMPEIVVSIASLRIGAVDLAVGNLFGSIMFNVMILAVDDIAFTRGPLLAAVGPSHLLAAAAAIIMTAIAVIGLTFRAERKRFPLDRNSAAIIAVYLALVYLLYQAR